MYQSRSFNHRLSISIPALRAHTHLTRPGKGQVPTASSPGCPRCPRKEFPRSIRQTCWKEAITLQNSDGARARLHRPELMSMTLWYPRACDPTAKRAVSTVTLCSRLLPGEGSSPPHTWGGFLHGSPNFHQVPGGKRLPLHSHSVGGFSARLLGGLPPPSLRPLPPAFAAHRTHRIPLLRAKVPPSPAFRFPGYARGLLGPGSQPEAGSLAAGLAGGLLRHLRPPRHRLRILCFPEAGSRVSAPPQPGGEPAPAYSSQPGTPRCLRGPNARASALHVGNSEEALTLHYISPEDVGSAVARGQEVNTVCSGKGFADSAWS